MNKLIIGILFLVGITFCGKSQMDLSDIEALKAKCPKVTHPYKIDSAAAASLVSQARSLKVGDQYQSVLEKMGSPSEVNLTHDKNNWSKKIGFSFVFLLRRDQPNGSVVEKNEKAIRVQFDTSKVVSRIDLPADPG